MEIVKIKLKNFFFLLFFHFSFIQSENTNHIGLVIKIIAFFIYKKNIYKL